MKKIALAAAVVLVLAPALLHAQTSASARGQGQATVSAGESSAEGRRSVALSAEANARIEADLETARARRLPEQPIRDRVAEGKAKGASEAQVVAASARTLAELQTSAEAMARAGRRDPGQDEVARGAQLIARGFTAAQVEGVARRAPAERSLVVALETLTSLQASGASTGKAVARVEALLAARATDAQLREASANATAAAHAGGTVGRGAGAALGAAHGGVAATAGSAAAGAGAATAGSVGRGAVGVAGGVGATVGGALKRP